MLKKLELFILITFPTIFDQILASTHWIVTENERIQPKGNSLFEMRRPDDLLAFLDQENHLNAIGELRKKMETRQPILDGKMAMLDTMADLWSWLRSFNADCVKFVIEGESFDFYTSVVTNGSHREGVTDDDYLMDESLLDNFQDVPDCTGTFSLDFSFYTFEHLSAMQNRKTLVQHEEIDLQKHFPVGMDLAKFGHRIAHALQKNSTSWLHLNLAAIYWRVKGDAYNALECARRAITTAPREFRDIPLLTTGGIFHTAGYSGDAAIVLHTALDLAPMEFHQHLALGHVYAVLGDFNRSLLCYTNALKIAPPMIEQAKQAQQAVNVIQCHQQLEESLLHPFKVLHESLDELEKYHNDYKKMLSLSKKLVSELFVPIGGYETCIQRIGDDNFSCGKSFTSHFLLHNEHTESRAHRLETVKSQVERMNNQIVNSVNFHKKTRNVKNIEQADDEIASKFYIVFMEPTKQPKYHDQVIKKSNSAFEKKNWPSEAECIELSSSETKKYVPVHLPPENKGYETHLFVSKFIRIDSGEEHSLPWHPPTCQTPENYDRKIIPPSLLSFAGNAGNSPEESLAPFITNLVKGADIAEIGQRILTASEARVAAPWVLSVLASLHWRIIGKPKNALDCLQQALSNVPDKFRDVPLLSIASIGQKFGFIDEALRTVKEALQINSVEPATNYLYATLLQAIGNGTGAIHHLKQSLRVDPDFMDGRALQLLRTLSCEEKLGPGH